MTFTPTLYKLPKPKETSQPFFAMNKPKENALKTIPAFLKPKDKIAICSSARKISLEEIAAAVQKIESMGYTAVVGKTIGLSDNQFAGSDKERAADLQSMIDDPEIRAVWLARGGYGTVRILDMVDFSSLVANPKWLIGYSDVTALLSHLFFCCNMTSLHAIMPLEVSPQTANLPCVNKIFDIISGKGNTIECISDYKPQNVEFEGEIIGGNLSVLYSLLGSESFGDTEGKILFIEDLDEYLYHIDRMMQALKRSGKLSKLKGLLVGAMTKMHDNAIPFGKSAYEIVAEAVESYDYPKVFDIPVGHIGKENTPLIAGCKTKVSQQGNKITISQL